MMLLIKFARGFLPILACLFLGQASAENADGVRILMKTGLGDIEIVLYPDKAPITATNFLLLVDGGHLDGGAFYRTVSPENDNGSPVISVIQGGVGGEERPFEPIQHETTEETGLLHVDGAISMARGAVGTASTEIFICIGAQPALDFGAERNPDGQGFAVFGQVVAGMDVARTIHEQPADAPTEFEYVAGQILTTPVEIISVERL